MLFRCNIGRGVGQIKRSPNLGPADELKVLVRLFAVLAFVIESILGNEYPVRKLRPEICRRRINSIGFFNAVYIFAVADHKCSAKSISFANAAISSLFNDPSAYGFDELAIIDSATEEKEWAFKIDRRYDTNFGEYPGFVKFGAKVRLRDKFTDVNETYYDGFNLYDLTIADVLTEVDYPIDSFGPAISSDAIRKLVANNLSFFEFAEEDTTVASRGGDFTASEDIWAGYIMGSVDINRLRVIGWVHVEHTDYTTAGNQVFLVEGDLDSVTAVNGKTSYTDILPALSLRYELSSQIQLRAAASRTIFRPNIADSVARVEVEEDEDGELSGVFGNADLKPYRSTNLDAGIEFYPTNLSLLAAGVFYKNIDNFIVTADLGGQGAYAAFDEAIVPINGDKAHLFGVELSYQQKMEFLPSPWDGVIVGANYTYVDSEGTLNDGRKIRFPGQASHIGNVSLGYEKGPLSLHAAMSFRSSYLDVVDEGDVAGQPVHRFVDGGHTQLNLSSKYQITPQFQVFVEAQNITDEPFYAYFGSPNYLSQYEEYGFTLYAGIRFTY